MSCDARQDLSQASAARARHLARVASAGRIEPRVPPMNCKSRGNFQGRDAGNALAKTADKES